MHLPTTGSEAVTSQRRPSSRSRVGAARRPSRVVGAAGAVLVLASGVLVGAAGTTGLTAAPGALVGEQAAPALEAAAPPAEGADVDVADLAATGPAPDPSPRAGTDYLSRSAERGMLTPADQPGSEETTAGVAAPADLPLTASGEILAEGDVAQVDAPYEDGVLTPGTVDLDGLVPDASGSLESETSPEASPVQREELVAAVAAAQAQVAAVRDVLLDPARAASVDAEIAAAQALLVRWPTPAPIEAVTFHAPGASFAEPVAESLGTPSLLEIVPPSSVAAARTESLRAAADALPVIETVDGVTRIDGVVVVNKTFPLGPDYNPGLAPELVAAFDTMVAGAQADGIALWIGSGFRSYADQTVIYDDYVARHGTERADTFSARPGHSEHQSGLAINVNQVHRGFSGTAAAAWVAEHAHEYGFVVRYPEGKEGVTGYGHESWHLRYLGVELATQLHTEDRTLEEYLGVTSHY
ncbi:D-alanyl-D-alanine carboxypeptidase family protein [Salana multivorans]